MKHRSSKLIIFMTVFIDLLGFGIVIPILPYISAEFLPARFQGQGAAALMAAFSLLQMLFSPFWGRLSERYGRRPILLVSLCGSTASYLLFALSHSYALLLFSRVLAGICGANITAAQAYIADITSEKERTAGMGLIGMAFGLGFALGPMIGGGATRLWSFISPGAHSHIGPGLAAAAICGTNLLWAVFRLPESLPPERRGQVHFRRFATTREVWANLRAPALGPLIALFFLVIFAFSNLEVSFALYTRDVLGLSQEWLYGIFTYVGLLMALVQGGLVRRLVHYVPEQILIILGLVIVSVGLFLLPLAARIGWVLLVMTLLSPGQGLAQPSIMSLISRSAAGSRQGGALGTAHSAASLARILGPVFGGVIFDRFGPVWPFWAAAVLMALSVGWAVYTRRQLLVHGHPLPVPSTPETAGA